MTRAKDISKIITDADLSGSLDVAGELQVGVDGTTAGLIRLMDSGSVTEEATISTDANGGLIFGGNSGAGELIFRTGSSTERLKIDSSGDYLFLGGTIRIKDSGNTAQRGAIYGSSSEFHLNSGVDNMVLTTSGGEAMRITSTGNVGIGKSAPLSPLDVTGGFITVSKDANSAGRIGASEYITGDVANDLVIQATGSGATKFYQVGVNSLNITSGGNVGIGTSSPSQKLDVNGTIVASTTSSQGARIERNGTTGGANFDSVLASGSLHFRTGATEHMRISSGGRVGIGTSSPAKTLHVATTGNATPYLHFTTDGTGHTASDGASVYLDRSTDGLNLSAYETNGTIVFRTDGATERMRIDSSGNVGIGTSSPSEQLHVSKSSNVNISVETTGSGGGANAGIRIKSVDGGDFLWQTGNATGNALRLYDYTSNTERMRIDSSGYFHIATDIADSEFYNTSFAHSISTTNTQPALFVENSGSSGNAYGLVIDFTDVAPDNNTSYFFQCQDSSTIRMKIWGDGDVVNHDNSYGAISDIKLKEQITDASSQWDDIKALQVRKYKMKEDVVNGDSDAHWRLGLIAQEVETAGMSGLVKNNPDMITNEDGDLIEGGTTTKSIKYSILYMKAVKALQEAMTRIETLETANTALEARITALETA